jgi:DNA polymerase eta
LDPYRRESLKILAIFKEMVPKGEIGKSSFSKIVDTTDENRESFD